MDKTKALDVCESFRASVIASLNNLDIEPDLKVELLIRFQTFYLKMLSELIQPKIEA